MGSLLVCAQVVFALSLPVLAQLLSLTCEPPQAQEVSEQGRATALNSLWGWPILKGVLLSWYFTQQLLFTDVSPFSHRQTASLPAIYVTWGTSILFFTAKPQDHKQMSSQSREVIHCQEISILCVSCSYLVLKISDNGHSEKQQAWLDGSVIWHFLQCSYIGSEKIWHVCTDYSFPLCIALET